MNSKVKSVLKYILSLGLAALLLYFAFSGIDWQEFLEDFVKTNWWYIILSMVAALVALIFRSERWREQLLPLDRDISRSTVWHGSNIGNFLSIVLPGVGEFVRCGHVSTRKASYDKTFGTIIMERSWDILAIVAMLVLALITNRSKLQPFMEANIINPLKESLSFSLWWILVIVLVLIVGFIWFVFKRQDRYRFCAECVKRIKGVIHGFATFGKMTAWKKIAFVLYTVGIWVMYTFMTYFTFLAVPGLEHLTFSDAVFISAVGNIASVIPTPGNVGAYHWLVGLAISTIYLGASGMDSCGLLCATLAHGSHAILLILLGIWSYIHVALVKKKKK